MGMEYRVRYRGRVWNLCSETRELRAADNFYKVAEIPYDGERRGLMERHKRYGARGFG